VAAAVTFLLSPGAAYINGVNLAVDGGSSLAKSKLNTFIHLMMLTCSFSDA
jgi:hypothetical protein